MPGRRVPQRAIAPRPHLLLVAHQSLDDRHAATGGSRDPREPAVGTVRRLPGGGERGPNIALAARTRARSAQASTAMSPSRGEATSAAASTAASS